MYPMFAREMLDFIRQNEIARVVVLASSDAALRTDSLIDGSQIRSLAVNWSVDDGLVDRLQAMSLDDFAIGSGRSDVLKTKLKQLHSAGVTRPLLELCEQEGIPTLALVSLVSEGDNVPDGIALASATNASLGLATLAEIAQWRPPRGWEWLMSGNIAPRELY
ncbi:Proteasome assembly chaperone 2 [Coemansia sp. Benny D115]|nr:Proteasome assembly chaperone 2 [Coemansia sp. Benny D115]